MQDSEIVTYTGKIIDINNLDISKICIEDIAHGLSFICRYSGQCKTFYSVAEHSINCCKAARYFGYGRELQLYTLYHDASEAYLIDLPTPIKKMLPEYKKIEENLQNLIYNSIGLKDISEENKKIVKDIDKIIFNKEWYELMDVNYFENYDRSVIPDLKFKFRDFDKVEDEFKFETKWLIKNLKK